MNKTKKIVTIVVAILIPLIVGGISAALTSNAMSTFGELNQPPLSPPGWLFPIAWTILYVLMGISSYLIFTNDCTDASKRMARKSALIFYVIQLIFNFCWSLLFFGAELRYIAFVWLIVMWVLIVITMIQTGKVNKVAMYLLIPYICWTTFAGYLNVMVAVLN